MDTLPLQITDEAARHIKDIMQAKQISTAAYGLRVGMKGSGCGATFLLGFDKPSPTDTIYQAGELPVYIEKKHLMYVLGLEIDYETTEQGSGFTFNKL